jgi:hypothetical protein
VLLTNVIHTVTGIVFFWKNVGPGGGTWSSSAENFGYPSFMTSLLLNVLLTSMIIARLLLHNRSFKNAMGPPSATDGLYKTIVTMLIESFALYTVNFLLFIGTWSAKSSFVYTFFPILVETQVRALFFRNIGTVLSNHGGEQAIAPLLIISRVTNRSPSTSDAISSETVGSMRFRSRRESAGGYGTIPDGNPMRPMGTYGAIMEELEASIDENPPPQQV